LPSHSHWMGPQDQIVFAVINGTAKAQSLSQWSALNSANSFSN